MSKIATFILYFALMISLLYSLEASAGDCSITSESNAVTFLTECSRGAPSLNAISPIGGSTGSVGFKEKILLIANGLLRFGALFAIGAIVYAGLQYTISHADDEKIKKAKSTGIYAVIGLFLILISFPIVDIIINFIYDTVAKN